MSTRPDPATVDRPHRTGYLVLASAAVLVVLGVDRLRSDEVLWGVLCVVAGALLALLVLAEQRRGPR